MGILKLAATNIVEEAVAIYILARKIKKFWAKNSKSRLATIIQKLSLWKFPPTHIRHTKRVFTTEFYQKVTVTKCHISTIFPILRDYKDFI